MTPAGVGGQPRLFYIGLGALLVSAFAASIAGMYLGSVSDVLILIPGLMVLLPPSINMRGSISGVLASRLSSSMHLGLFDVAFDRQSVLGYNLRASIIATVIISGVVGLLAELVSAVLGIEVIGVIDLILISVISGVISGIIVMAITIVVAVMSYRYGVDLDMIGAPTVTTSGDIVTLPILVVSAIFVIQLDPAIRNLLFLVILVILISSILYTVFLKGEAGHIVREIVPLLIPLALLGTIAGITYTLALDQLVTMAALLIFIPPFMGVCGSIGGILCSRLATGMHMGSIEPSHLPDRDILPHFSSTYLYALVLLPLLAVIADVAAGMLGLDSPGLGLMLIISLASGLIVMSIVNFFAYGTASLSFRYGLDPDNFGIPVITSVIDMLGAIVLIAVINILF